MPEAPQPSPWAVEATQVGRSYGPTVALRGVNLRVGWGERVVLLGANGAGKTTLLRLLALLLRPSTGTVRIGGFAPAEVGRRLHHLIGFHGHSTALYPDLTVQENLDFCARLFGLGSADAAAGALLETFGLAGLTQRRASQLSRGQQQRLGLVRALQHQPPLVLLDEPDTSLDASSLAQLTRVLLDKEGADAARTVIVSTHDLNWARQVATRAVCLSEGRIIYDGPMSALTAAPTAGAATSPRLAPIVASAGSQTGLSGQAVPLGWGSA